MSTFPSDWTDKPIGDLLAPLEDGRTLHQGWSPQCEKSPSESDTVWGVLKTTAVQAGFFLPEQNKCLPVHLSPRPLLEVHQGDILITCAGPRARCGISCLVRKTRPHLMISGKMYRFRAIEPQVNSRYLGYYLQTGAARLAIDRMKTGGSDSGLNLTHERFRRLPIPIAPRAAQDHIVDAIEEQFSRLDAGMAALERVRSHVKRMRAAVLYGATRGQLAPQQPSDGSSTDLVEAICQARTEYLSKNPYPGSGRPPSKVPKHLPTLPEGWRWASIDQVSTRVVDGVHKKPSYVSSGIPFVTVRNLTSSTGISFDRLNYITPEDHAVFCRRAHPEPGDLLVSKDGTLGVVRAVRDPRPFSLFVSVALIKPVVREMTDYLELALSSPLVQSQIVRKGTGLQHIHLEDLRATCVPVPPLAEQRRIVLASQREMSRIDHLEAAMEAAATRAATLRYSILSSAFAGTLLPQSGRAEANPGPLDHSADPPSPAQATHYGQASREASQEAAAR